MNIGKWLLQQTTKCAFIATTLLVASPALAVQPQVPGKDNQECKIIRYQHDHIIAEIRMLEDMIAHLQYRIELTSDYKEKARLFERVKEKRQSLVDKRRELNANFRRLRERCGLL